MKQLLLVLLVALGVPAIAQFSDPPAPNSVQHRSPKFELAAQAGQFVGATILDSKYLTPATDPQLRISSIFGLSARYYIIKRLSIGVGANYQTWHTHWVRPEGTVTWGPREYTTPTKGKSIYGLCNYNIISGRHVLYAGVQAGKFYSDKGLYKPPFSAEKKHFIGYDANVHAGYRYALVRDRFFASAEIGVSYTEAQVGDVLAVPIFLGIHFRP